MELKEMALDNIAKRREALVQSIEERDAEEIIELCGNIAAQVKVLDALYEYCYYCEDEDDFVLSALANHGNKVINELNDRWLEKERRAIDTEFEELIDNSAVKVEKDELGKQAIKEFGLTYANHSLNVFNGYLEDENMTLVDIKKVIDCCHFAKNSGKELNGSCIDDFCANVHKYDNAADLFKNAYKEYKVFDNTYCLKDSRKEDYNGKMLILNPCALKSEYRNEKGQLWVAEGGNGCSPEARGRTTVFATCVADGEKGRWYRDDFLGVADMSKMPEWVNATTAEEAVEAEA